MLVLVNTLTKKKKKPQKKRLIYNKNNYFMAKNSKQLNVGLRQLFEIFLKNI